MELVQVDVVGLQPVEAVANRAADVRGRGAGLVRRHIHPELRREHDPVAPTREDAAEERLRRRRAVDVGRVEEVHFRIERGVDDPTGTRLVHATAEVVASEPDDADLERADLPRFHGPDASRVRRYAAPRIDRSHAVAPVPWTASSQPCR